MTYTIWKYTQPCYSGTQALADWNTKRKETFYPVFTGTEIGALEIFWKLRESAGFPETIQMTRTQKQTRTREVISLKKIWQAIAR